MQDAQINLRLTRTELAELDALAEYHGLNRSNMLRFLSREKARALGISVRAVAEEDGAVPRS